MSIGILSFPITAPANGTATARRMHPPSMASDITTEVRPWDKTDSKAPGAAMPAAAAIFARGHTHTSRASLLRELHDFNAAAPLKHGFRALAPYESRLGWAGARIPDTEPGVSMHLLAMQGSVIAHRVVAAAQ